MKEPNRNSLLLSHLDSWKEVAVACNKSYMSDLVLPTQNRKVKSKH